MMCCLLLEIAGLVVDSYAWNISVRCSVSFYRIIVHHSAGGGRPEFDSSGTAERADDDVVMQDEPLPSGANKRSYWCSLVGAFIFVTKDEK